MFCRKNIGHTLKKWCKRIDFVFHHARRFHPDVVTLDIPDKEKLAAGPSLTGNFGVDFVDFESKCAAENRAFLALLDGGRCSSFIFELP